MTARYVVTLWRPEGARFGAADQVNTYRCRKLETAERNAAAWMAFYPDVVATVCIE